MKTNRLWPFVLAASFLGGCSTSADPTSGTTGRTITLATTVEVRGTPTDANRNALGWSIRLSRAYLSIGALYYFQGNPVISMRGRAKRSAEAVVATLLDFVERPAYAHPGHYVQGEAMGQMIVPTTVDLLGGATVLASGAGVTGLTSSARFTWQSPAQGPLAPQLGTHVVLTQGVAEKGDSRVEFLATADANDLLDGDGLPQVAGCAFGAEAGQVGVNMDGDGTVKLMVVPSVWFDQVDFSYVIPSAPRGDRADASDDASPPGDRADASGDAASGSDAQADGPVDLRGSIAWQGFLRGVKKGTGYLFSYSRVR